jgi:hypothetical protein
VEIIICSNCHRIRLWSLWMKITVVERDIILNSPDSVTMGMCPTCQDIL